MKAGSGPAAVTPASYEGNWMYKWGHCLHLADGKATTSRGGARKPAQPADLGLSRRGAVLFRDEIG